MFSWICRFSAIFRTRKFKMMNIDICDSHMVLTIEKSKTDVYREGNKLYIARTNTNTCPVVMTERYIKLAGLVISSDQFLFRNLSYCKNSNMYKLRTDNRPLSYTRAREIILDAFSRIGLNKSLFGLHSLRSGGATSACASGVSDRVFKKHGRWRSEKAKDGYVKETLTDKLYVSKHLGI